MRLTLPWPPKQLSPNGRLHWTRKYKAKNAYQADVYSAAKAGGARILDAETLAVTITFCPPDRRRRDKDNAIACFKSGQDALALLLGVDDANWRVTYAPGWGEPVKGGAVVVEVAE